jgi:hypothetical protein
MRAPHVTHIQVGSTVGIVHGDRAPTDADRKAMAAIVKAAGQLMGEPMSIELPNGKGPGKWQRVIVDEFGDTPRWTALIRCPECKVFLPLTDHTIASDGQVTPSVAHDPRLPPCSWHPTPKLLGWSPCPPAPEPKPFHEPCGRCGAKGRQLGGWGVGWGFLLVCPDCVKQLSAHNT